VTNILLFVSMGFRLNENDDEIRCKRKSSLIHSADLCRGRVRVMVWVRGRVRAVIDRYAM